MFVELQIYRVGPNTIYVRNVIAKYEMIDEKSHTIRYNNQDWRILKMVKAFVNIAMASTSLAKWQELVDQNSEPLVACGSDI